MNDDSDGDGYGDGDGHGHGHLHGDDVAEDGDDVAIEG